MFNYGLFEGITHFDFHCESIGHMSINHKLIMKAECFPVYRASEAVKKIYSLGFGDGVNTFVLFNYL